MGLEAARKPLAGMRTTRERFLLSLRREPLEAAALWSLFHRNGRKGRFEDVPRRSVCLHCWRRHGVKIRGAWFELTEEAPLDVSLAMPGELDWKRELRRRRR